MNEVQVKEIVREIVREEFRHSLSEASYDLGKKQYTDKKMTPTEILDLAMAYASTPANKMLSGKLGNMVNVANDLAKLNGTTQLDAKTRGKQPALILFLLKNSLVSKDEYIKLYKDLIEKQISVVKSLKNADPASRMVGGAAARQAHKDMKGEFEESVNELKTLSNGNFKIKKQYNTFSDYEKNAKIGDTILKYDKKSSMKDMISNDELHQNAKRYLNKVHSIGTDGVNVTIFGKQTPASIHPSDKKELAVVVLESVVNEMSVNDVHFKEILRMYDHGGSFTKKKVAAVVRKNPKATRKDIIDAMLDMDYKEITDVQDELGIKESVEGDRIQNLNNRIKALKDKISATKSPEQKNKFQNTLKNALQSLSNIRKKQSESVNEEDSSEETLKGLKEMAIGDLERIADYAEMIFDRMEEGQELESWMYSQITLAVDQLNSVHDAMDGIDGVKESVNEENPGLWANIRAKKARGEKPAHGNSDAHKDAVKAGKEINNEESVNEAKYDVYHKTYTSAIQAGLDWAKKSGYDYDEEEAAREIGMGPRKPSEGKTNKFHLSLRKDFKPQKKMLHIQVYGMKNSYELNVYIN
jgi:hypothetical protein